MTTELFVKMLSEKEEILKDMIDRVGDGINRQTVAQKVEQFMRHGNIFLFFEMMNLRKEIEILKSRTRASTTAQQKKR